MAAFEALPQHGVRWLETDLGITKDQQVMVLHDDYLDRTTDGHGLLTEATGAAVQALSAGAWFAPQFAAERVPTMAALVAFLNRTHTNANIELKAVVGDDANALADELCRQFARALDQLDVEILVSSFSPIMLLKLQALRPQTRCAVLFTQATRDDSWLLTAQACHAVAIHPESAGLTRADIQTMHAHGYAVNVWTVDSLSRGNQLLNWGADGIFTNRAADFPQH